MTQYFQIEPNQGTHSFHNIISFGVGYLTVQHSDDGWFFNTQLLQSLKLEQEIEYVFHYSLSEKLQLLIDGKKREGIVNVQDNLNKSR